MPIDPDDRRWLVESGLVDDGLDLDAVRLHVGGPVGWYLRLAGRGAITFGDHVWFREGAKLRDRALLAHELVHVAQYRERGFAPFLWRYALDLVRARFRYSRDLPLEAPAYERQRRARELLGE